MSNFSSFARYCGSLGELSLLRCSKTLARVETSGGGPTSRRRGGGRVSQRPACSSSTVEHGPQKALRQSPSRNTGRHWRAAYRITWLGDIFDVAGWLLGLEEPQHTFTCKKQPRQRTTHGNEEYMARRARAERTPERTATPSTTVFVV